MKRQCILHIGPMKTGSTAIQSWLSRNRQRLADIGIHLPEAFRSPNHSILGRIAEAVAEAGTLQPDQGAVLDRLAEELAALPDSVTSVVISGEMMGERLRDPAQVAVLRRFIDPFFDSFRVIVYLRRQDQQSVSLYSTALREGRQARLMRPPPDYAKLLNAWAEVFGRDALEPRIYDRKALPAGNVVADFVLALGLDWTERDVAEIEANTSLSWPAQEFLRQLAAGGPGPNLRNLPGYAAMLRILDSRHVGTGQLPTRAEARAYMARLRLSNEAVRAAWFPDRPRLFSNDFSRYPEQPPPPPSDAEVLAVALDVTQGMLRAAPAEGGPGQRPPYPIPQPPP